MNKLIRIKESTRYPGLFVHKYAKQVFYKNLWNRDPNILESRGHVYDSKGNCVIRPLKKLFHPGEMAPEPRDDTLVIAVRKVNGFMAAVTWVPEYSQAIVSTTGSLDSEFCDMARGMMPKVIQQVEEERTGLTYLFEIVHPQDPHIIVENIGVYYLGYRFTWSEDIFLHTMNVFGDSVILPKSTVLTYGEVKRRIKDVKHEGYILYDINYNPLCKMKSPYYTALKVLARCKTLGPTVERRIPEQFRYLLRKAEQERAEFLLLGEQERLHELRNWV